MLAFPDQSGHYECKRRDCMAEVQQEKNEETKTKGLSQSENKHSVNRMANKQRKKRAHRRNLRKSNANG